MVSRSTVPRGTSQPSPVGPETSTNDELDRYLTVDKPPRFRTISVLDRRHGRKTGSGVAALFEPETDSRGWLLDWKYCQRISRTKRRLHWAGRRRLRR